MNPYMNSGVPRFQMDSPRDQPLALQRILNLHSYWNAYLFGFEYFQEIPLQCSRDQPPLANTRQYTFNRLGMNNQPTLVETETCPAWARVRLAGQGAWDFQDNWQLGCCRHTEFAWHIIGNYTHCNCKYQLSTKHKLTELILNLQVSPKIDGINGIINWIMKQMVINAKHLL